MKEVDRRTDGRIFKIFLPGFRIQSKRLKGGEGGALLPKFLKERLKTKTGIFRGLEFKPNQTYNLGIFL